MGIELTLPFVGSLLFVWLLRRLDKSNINLKKFKGILERGEKQLDEIALQRQEELKDATTELDILQINAKKHIASFQDEMSKAEKMISEIENRSSHLGNMVKDINSLETTTHSVQGQLAYIRESLEKVEFQHKRIKRIEERFQSIDSEGVQILKSFQQTIDKKFQEQLELSEESLKGIFEKADFYEKEIQEELKARQDKLSEEMKQEYSLLEASLRESGRELSSDIQEKFKHHLGLCKELENKIAHIESHVNDAIPKMLHEVKENTDIHLSESELKIQTLLQTLKNADENFHKTIHAFRENIEQQKQEVSQAFLGEVETLRDQVRQLDFETISKKDEIIQVTRKEASKIEGHIEEFKDFYLKSKDEYMNKISHDKNSLEQVLMKIYTNYKDKYHQMAEESIRLGQEDIDHIEKIIKAGNAQFSEMKQELHLLHEESKKDYQEHVQKGTEEFSQKTQAALDLYEQEVDSIKQTIEAGRSETSEMKEDLNLLHEESKKDYLEHVQKGTEEFSQKTQAALDLYEQEVDNIKQTIEAGRSETSEMKEELNLLHEESKKDYQEHVQNKTKEFRERAQVDLDTYEKFTLDLSEKEIDAIGKVVEAGKSKISEMKEELNLLYEGSKRDYLAHIQKETEEFNGKIKNALAIYKEETDGIKRTIGEGHSEISTMKQDLNLLHEESKKDYLGRAQEETDQFNEKSQVAFELYEKETRNIEKTIEAGKAEVSEMKQELQLLRQESKKDYQDHIQKETDQLNEKIKTAFEIYEKEINGVERVIEAGRSEISEMKQELQLLHQESKKDYLGRVQEETDQFNEKSQATFELYEKEARNIEKTIEAGKAEVSEMKQELQLLHQESKKDYLGRVQEETDQFNEKSQATFELYEKEARNIEKTIEAGKAEVSEMKQELQLLREESKKDYQDHIQEETNQLNEKIQATLELYEKEARNIEKTIEAGKAESSQMKQEWELLHQESKKDYQDHVQEESDQLNEKVQATLELYGKEFHDKVEEKAAESKAQVKQLEKYILDFKNFHDTAHKNYVELTQQGESAIKEAAHESSENFQKLHSGLKQDYLEKTHSEKNKLESVLAKLFGHYKEKLAQEIEKNKEESSGILEKIEAFSDKAEKILTKNEAQLLENYRESHENYLDELKKEFHSHQDELLQIAEKWESRLESLSVESRESIHKGQMSLEKQRSEMLEGSREILSEFLAEEKGKFDEDARLTLQKMRSEAKEISNLKVDFQTKQSDVIDYLKQEKKKLESELKTVSYEQLSLFEKESGQKADKFREKMDQTANEHLEKVTSEIESAESSINLLKENYTKEISRQQEKQKHDLADTRATLKSVTKEIKSLHEQLEAFKVESQVVEVIENKANELRDLAVGFDTNIEKMSEKQNIMDHLFSQIDELKELRVQLDAKISMLSDKKEKVDQMEEKLNIMIHAKDEVEERSASLDDIKTKLDMVVENQKQVENEKQKTDMTLEELLNQKKLVESSIESMNTQDRNITDLTQQVNQIDLILKKLDVKAENLQTHMTDMSTQMSGIEKNESEIQAVQEKFLQIENLLEDIEKRKTQIEVMRKRYEELKDSLNSSVEHIVQIENSAEEKVKKLAEFVNAIGGDASNQSLEAHVPLQTTKKDVVLRLAQMGWSRAEIAEKINVDMSIVDTILSTNP